ncbi:MAG: hypothetical protein ABF825_07105 [Acetobacter syzygii]|nr:hypothetical protein [Acetobacter syzygii]
MALPPIPPLFQREIVDRAACPGDPGQRKPLLRVRVEPVDVGLALDHL